MDSSEMTYHEHVRFIITFVLNCCMHTSHRKVRITDNVGPSVTLRREMKIMIITLIHLRQIHKIGKYSIGNMYLPVSRPVSRPIDITPS